MFIRLTQDRSADAEHIPLQITNSLFKSEQNSKNYLTHKFFIDFKKISYSFLWF